MDWNVWGTDHIQQERHKDELHLQTFRLIIWTSTRPPPPPPTTPLTPSPSPLLPPSSVLNDSVHRMNIQYDDCRALMHRYCSDDDNNDSKSSLRWLLAIWKISYVTVHHFRILDFYFNSLWHQINIIPNRNACITFVSTFHAHTHTHTQRIWMMQVRGIDIDKLIDLHFSVIISNEHGRELRAYIQSRTARFCTLSLLDKFQWHFQYAHTVCAHIPKGSFATSMFPVQKIH